MVGVAVVVAVGVGVVVVVAVVVGVAVGVGVGVVVVVAVSVAVGVGVVVVVAVSVAVGVVVARRRAAMIFGQPIKRSSLAFRPGQLVRFAPPPGAYSDRSEQANRAGQSGMIVNVWRDDVVSVLFGLGPCIIVNANYLE